jgi:hypothetical protein
VGVSPTETGIYPHWFLVFGCAVRRPFALDRLPRRQREGFGFVDGFDTSPLVCWWPLFSWAIRQPELVRRPIFGITSAASLRYLNETERLHLAQRWRDCMAVDAVFLKVIECHRQFAIIAASVMRKLDLDTVEDAASR